MSSTQKAFFVEKKFGNLVIDTIPIPTPGPGEILIKVQAAALNPVDWKIQKYGLFVESYPATLGTDLAGDVEAVGEGVTEFEKGDRVFGQGQINNRNSAFQQYTIALASTTAKIPSNKSYDEVATLPVALSAAYVGLYNQNPYGLGFTPPTSAAALGKYAGTPLVVLGGSSSVGQLTIQLAKLSGFSPIITTASLKHTDSLKSLGATHIIDRDISSAQLSAEIAKVASKPIKAVYDAISSPQTQQTGMDILAPGGQLAIVLPSTTKPDNDKKSLHILGVLRLPYNIQLLETLYHDLISGLVEKGAIQPNRVEVLPGGLAGIAEGLKRLEKNEVSRQKLVAHPQETA